MSFHTFHTCIWCTNVQFQSELSNENDFKWLRLYEPVRQSKLTLSFNFSNQTNTDFRTSFAMFVIVVHVKAGKRMCAWIVLIAGTATLTGCWRKTNQTNQNKFRNWKSFHGPNSLAAKVAKWLLLLAIHWVKSFIIIITESGGFTVAFQIVNHLIAQLELANPLSRRSKYYLYVSFADTYTIHIDE